MSASDIAQISLERLIDKSLVRLVAPWPSPAAPI